MILEILQVESNGIVGCQRGPRFIHAPFVEHMNLAIYRAKRACAAKQRLRLAHFVETALVSLLLLLVEFPWAKLLI